MTTALRDSRTPSQRDLLYMLLYAMVLVALAWMRPLALPDEGRYGDVGRWMLRSGDWLTPRIDGLPFFHKPPLLYWLEGMAMGLAGVHPWVARLVPAVHAWLMVLATQRYTLRYLGRAVADRAALMLGASMLVLGGGDYINCDMVVATWISICIMAFAAALQSEGRDRRRLGWLGFVAGALGLLSKGLIGVALPGLVLLLWLIQERRWWSMLRLPWVTGMVGFLIVGLPWFVLLEHRYGGFFHYFFIEQQFTRYVGTGFNNRQPWPFYILCLAILFFPFSTLIRWRAPMAVMARGQLATWRLAWIWLLCILVFFSIPASKLVGYILPVMPALAILAALAWPQVHAQRTTRWLVLLGSLLLGTVLVVLGAWTWPSLSLPWTVRALAIGAGLLWLGGVLMSRWLVPGKLLMLWAVQSIMTLVAVNAGVAFQSTAKGSLMLAEYIKQHDPHPYVITYAGYPFDLPFYLDTRAVLPTLGDWKERLTYVRDDGDQQLIDGLAFEPAAGRVLLEKSALDSLSRQYPNAWLVTPADLQDERVDRLYKRIQVMGRWAVWRLKAEGA